jgi:hypothetical protein
MANGITNHARQVLGDCKIVVNSIRNDEGNRIKWIAAVVLLRTIGHIFVKVDALESNHANKIISSSWAELKNSKPEPHIFWNFIEKERNNILKEYRQSVLTIIEAESRIDFTRNILPFEMSKDSKSRPPTIKHVIKSGYFDGKLPLELLQEAILFWENYLDYLGKQAYVI